MSPRLVLLGCLLLHLYQVVSECGNACSGHGMCTDYDMCICWRNWQGNDCSERICQFGRAFVDSPLGDLDASNALTGPDNEIVIENSFQYPYGTSELYPTMKDSEGSILENSAHDYVECSNAGKCDRDLGICDCFPGFAGAACQYIECPKNEFNEICSGHGSCYNLKDIAKKNYNSVYSLWDKETGTACICESDYMGYDCSFKKCPYGLDPLYRDDINAVRYGAYYMALLTSSNTYDFYDKVGRASTYGKFGIKFYDISGKMWKTKPIAVGASCSVVVAALEALPQGVVPGGTINCYKAQIINKSPLKRSQSSYFTFDYYSVYDLYLRGYNNKTVTFTPSFWVHNYKNSYSGWSATDESISGDVYRLQFTGNPGALIRPEINIFPEGMRQSVYTDGDLIARTWSDGEQGESIDYFSKACDGVVIRILVQNNIYYLRFQSNDDKNRFKACIGTTDLDDSNDYMTHVDGKGYQWDAGTVHSPHVVKIAKYVQDFTDGAYYIIFVFDTSISYDGQSGESEAGAFRLLHPFQSRVVMDDREDEKWVAFATDGQLTVASSKSEVSFDFASQYLYAFNTSYDLDGADYDGDVSCEYADKQIGYLNTCLDKNDYFFIIDPYNVTHNPPYVNMYQALSLYKQGNDDRRLSIDSVYDEDSITNRWKLRNTSHFFNNIIYTDTPTNWAAHAYGDSNFHIYKFVLNTTTSFEYIAECSNRGLCNRYEGLCECFDGYAGNSCNIADTVVTDGQVL